MSEVEWRPIPGFEGYYDISSDGEVLSLRRKDPLGRMVGGHLLSAPIGAHGYRFLNLHRKGKGYVLNIHRLVMLAFVGTCPEGYEVLHGDGDRTNNRISNLSYGTRGDNNRDAVKHGTHPNAAKTHCLRGHAFTEDNIYRYAPHGPRACRKCRALYSQQHQARKRQAA